jgi:fibronectin type 3 domain-containing protein
VRDIGLTASTGRVRVGLAMLIAGVVLCGCGSPESESGSGGTGAAGSAPPPGAPDIASPTTPSGLTANAISASQIALGWSPSTDNVAVAGYRVYQDGVFLAAAGNVTTYQVTGLTSSTNYSYRVDAVDAAGNASGKSAPASAITLASNTATLGWEPVAGAAGYRLYYGTTQGGPYFQSLGNGVEMGDATSYTMAGLAGRTRYYFVVTAFNATNESAFSNEVFKDVP